MKILSVATSLLLTDDKNKETSLKKTVESKKFYIKL